MDTAVDPQAIFRQVPKGGMALGHITTPYSTLLIWPIDLASVSAVFRT